MNKYFTGLAVFASVIIAVSIAVVFLTEEQGFTEKNAVMLMKQHYQPVSLQDFHSEILDRKPVKEAGYVWQENDRMENGIPVPGYIGFAEATINYDDSGKVESVRMILVNKTIPKFVPAVTWNCDGKNVHMLTDETPDYLALMLSGDKLVDAITQERISAMSKPRSANQPSMYGSDATAGFNSSIQEGLDYTIKITEILIVWYYNPEKQQEYNNQVSNVTMEIEGIGCEIMR